MTALCRAYEPETDYMRVRRFLTDTFALYQRALNCLIDRWSFCRYGVIPFLSASGVRNFSACRGSYPPPRDQLALWEKGIGIWETAAGEIVGVVHSENEEPGEAWVQIHPDHTEFYEEMVAYAETYLADRIDGLGYVKLYINSDCELETIASARGYKQLKYRTPYLEYTIGDAQVPQLPNGYGIKSVLEEDDVDRRRRAKAIAFGGNYAPSDWTPASAFAEIQHAPDYRRDLDLFIVAPTGEYVSFCTIWVDVQNQYGVFEPVGTHAEYQGRGLGRTLLMEGFRRMAAYGATRSFISSSNPFYLKVGFRDTQRYYSPWIRYLAE